MRSLLLTILLGLSGTHGLAQTVPEPDPMDLSRQEERIGSELPTVEQVKGLKAMAEQSFQEGDCDKALPFIREWTEQSNRLANLVRAGLKPFYDASSDDRRSVNVDPLLPMERLVGDLLLDRNTGWVMEAECLIKDGEVTAGAARLMHALDYIGATGRERNLWARARENLWQLVGALAEKPA